MMTSILADLWALPFQFVFWLFLLISLCKKPVKWLLDTAMQAADANQSTGGVDAHMGGSNCRRARRATAMELGKIMEKHRHRLWLNIMEDLGPPEGCVIPTWPVCVYMLLFPLQGLRWIIDRHMGFDPLRMVWTIHGIDYSAHLFHRLAITDGAFYRFITVNKVLTIEIVAEPPRREK